MNAHHSRMHSSSCKDTCGSILKQDAFLYIHAELPSGELVAFRMRLSDSDSLRWYQHRRTGNVCGLQRVPRPARGERKFSFRGRFESHI
jgi:hypothetical protein